MAPDLHRRGLLGGAACAWLAGAQRPAAPQPAIVQTEHRMLTVHTFGDSVLDCGHYNAHGVTPGQLLVRNDDGLFPEFAGHDLQARGPAALLHRAVDGATVDDLQAQLTGTPFAPGDSVVLVSIGGNDLIRGLAGDTGPGVQRFAVFLDIFLKQLPPPAPSASRRLLLANVYDPTFGDDAHNFLNVPARTARANHRRVNDAIARLAVAHGGQLVDLRAHFLRGDPSWFTRIIEPSLVGASEVRRAVLALL